jgi:hypothetical protein
MTIKFICLCALILLQSDRPPTPRPTTVVVGVVMTVVGREVADGIVSDVTIAVEETLKGRVTRTLTTEILGGRVRAGTENELSMGSSSIEIPQEGDRIVLFLDGANRPTKTHGESLLQLDANDHVRGSNKTLADIRLEVKK